MMRWGELLHSGTRHVSEAGPVCKDTLRVTPLPLLFIAGVVTQLSEMNRQLRAEYLLQYRCHLLLPALLQGYT